MCDIGTLSSDLNFSRLKVRGSFQPSARPKPAKVRHAKRKSSEKSERSEKSAKSSDESACKKAKVETEAVCAYFDVRALVLDFRNGFSLMS